jgi:hypothetical protein
MLEALSLGSYLLLVDYTGRLFREGKVVISADVWGRPLLADELDDCRNQVGRHGHDGLALGEKSRFVLSDLYVFALIVVLTTTGTPSILRLPAPA